MGMRLGSINKTLDRGNGIMLRSSGTILELSEDPAINSPGISNKLPLESLTTSKGGGIINLFLL